MQVCVLSGLDSAGINRSRAGPACGTPVRDALPVAPALREPLARIARQCARTRHL